MRKLIGILVFFCSSAALGADEYPARTVRVIVPFAPGGGTDIVARLLGQQLSQKLGQSFVIENRPAGSGIVGADLVAKAPADGYTLLFAFSSLSSSAKLFSHLPYDPIRDFAPVALATTSPLLAVVPASLQANNVGEFVAYAKARPGKLNYGSSGPGSSPHLATELFLSMTGTQMAHIAYKGIAPAITALLADEVQFSLVPIAVGMPHVRSGKLRALGVAGLTRSSAAPELPTIAESGLPGFEVIGWWGLLAPAKTPRSAVDLLNRELRAALEASGVRRTLLDQGMDPAPGTPEQFGALIKTDMDKWGEIGRRLGVKLD
ncbi:MAG TPA: tripartite tricarboxylate transporter substrate binding protein [Burkholderiales bacterium]|jgi:tripartite-type tricarboxylate transporter receptor subunit TctC